MTIETTEAVPGGWAIVELMGHRQTAGRITEVELGGAKMLRVDTPRPDGAEVVVSQFYAAGGAARPAADPAAGPDG